MAKQLIITITLEEHGGEEGSSLLDEAIITASERGMTKSELITLTEKWSQSDSFYTATVPAILDSVSGLSRRPLKKQLCVGLAMDRLSPREQRELKEWLATEERPRLESLTEGCRSEEEVATKLLRAWRGRPRPMARAEELPPERRRKLWDKLKGS